MNGIRRLINGIGVRLGRPKKRRKETPAKAHHARAASLQSGQPAVNSTARAERDMAPLTEWALDWLDLSGVKPSDHKIDDPITLFQRAFAALAGIIAVLSSPAINVLVPNLNNNAALVLRVVIALATLIAVNYVVTAKDVVETTSGFGSQTLRIYRFSTTERLIARGVVAIALVMLLLNLVPAPEAPRNCNLTAIVDWQTPDGSASPLFLTLTAGGRTERFTADKGKPVAMQVLPAHLSAYSMVLEWSDNSRSDFGGFSGCSPVVDRRSRDGRAKVDLAVR
jgi:hypothetical protein